MTDAILIVGSGTTSRANVEALMDDYFYANPELKVFLAVYDAPSEGQIWAAQYAMDKEKSVKSFITVGSRMAGIGTTISRQESDSPIREICELGHSLEAFVIWNDEDSSCLSALAILSEFGIPALDLTNGLLEIKPTGEVKEVVRPEIPVEEELGAEEPVKIAEDLELADDEVNEYEDPLYEAINTVAVMFAEAIARELAKVLHK